MPAALLFQQRPVALELGAPLGGRIVAQVQDFQIGLGDGHAQLLQRGAQLFVDAAFEFDAQVIGEEADLPEAIAPGVFARAADHEPVGALRAVQQGREGFPEIPAGPIVGVQPEDPAAAGELQRSVARGGEIVDPGEGMGLDARLQKGFHGGVLRARVHDDPFHPGQGYAGQQTLEVRRFVPDDAAYGKIQAAVSAAALGFGGFGGRGHAHGRKPGRVGFLEQGARSVADAFPIGGNASGFRSGVEAGRPGLPGVLGPAGEP
jgi:hypothetical protein